MATATTTTVEWRLDVSSSCSEGSLEQVARKAWSWESDDAADVFEVGVGGLGLLCEVTG